ncbi:MAG: hypothetical protein WDW38_004888 [Sanguina aurantia]
MLRGLKWESCPAQGWGLAKQVSSSSCSSSHGSSGSHGNRSCSHSSSSSSSTAATAAATTFNWAEETTFIECTMTEFGPGRTPVEAFRDQAGVMCFCIQDLLLAAGQGTVKAVNTLKLKLGKELFGGGGCH